MACTLWVTPRTWRTSAESGADFDRQRLGAALHSSDPKCDRPQLEIQDYWGGLKEGTVELPISELVPAPVKAEAEQIIADIKSGALQPFTGPIKDQAGVEKIPAGVSATNAELASMNYYVEGMKAEMPK